MRNRVDYLLYTHNLREEFVMPSSLPQVLIIELGSQYTLLIERELRELGVRSVVFGPQRAGTWLQQHQPKAVILSGSASSVYRPDSQQPPKEVFQYLCQDNCSVAVLGICYGMQWLANYGRGVVASAGANREYGHAAIDLEGIDCLFNNTPRQQQVWMSHGDSVMEAPGFEILARSQTGGIAAMRSGRVWGVQFHPEVKDTPFGSTILKNFLQFAHCEQDWKPSSLVQSIRDDVLMQVGDKRVIYGFSGGVDSTTLSAILAPILKDELVAITIDGGHLRKNELWEIEGNAKAAGVSLRVIGARHEFSAVMEDTIDAEEKRKRFKQVYQSIFVRVAKEVGARVMLQGTLAPDRIESGGTGGDKIKSHHNVGLDVGTLLQLHPIDHLFKYEIRALAKEIGLPESVYARQPFPGPGLFLRVIGTPATREKLDLVRWADAEVKRILVRHGLYDKISQLVVAYLGLNTVGVKGDSRVYSGAIGVRAVETVDFMTARPVHLPPEVTDEIVSTLIRDAHVVRVWPDPTPKPPATIEFE